MSVDVDVDGDIDVDAGVGVDVVNVVDVVDVVAAVFAVALLSSSPTFLPSPRWCCAVLRASGSRGAPPLWPQPNEALRARDLACAPTDLSSR